MDTSRVNKAMMSALAFSAPSLDPNTGILSWGKKGRSGGEKARARAMAHKKRRRQLEKEGRKNARLHGNPRGRSRKR